MQSGILRNTETSSCLWTLQQILGNDHMMMLQVIVAAMIFNKQGADPGEGRAENDAESVLRQCKVQLHGQMEELVNGLISSKSIQA